MEVHLKTTLPMIEMDLVLLWFRGGEDNDNLDKVFVRG